MKPVPSAERHLSLDVIRGVALLGVLLVNLLDGFRGSLFEHMATFHSHPGWLNHAVDIFNAWALEFKAITLFSFLFGVGVAVQAERAIAHSVNSSRFFTRRFLVLFGIGLFHLLVIWNGDILALYAICGLLLIPFTGRSSRFLFVFGAAVVVLDRYVPIFAALFPTEEALRAHAIEATRVYATGSFREILVFRWHETRNFLGPFVISSLPRTFGLMLLGMAAWRAGILKHPQAYRGLLKGILVAGGICGGLIMGLVVRTTATKQSPPVVLEVFYPFAVISLAFAYGAGLLLLLNWTNADYGDDGGQAGLRKPALLTRLFAAGGRMALTNYLMQSIVFTLVFYGFGFGLFGKLAPAITALMGVTVFGAQLVASYYWLRAYRFGPVEWFWRWLTYGERPEKQISDCETFPAGKV